MPRGGAGVAASQSRRGGFTVAAGSIVSPDGTSSQAWLGGIAVAAALLSREYFGSPVGAARQARLMSIAALQPARLVRRGVAASQSQVAWWRRLAVSRRRGFAGAAKRLTAARGCEAGSVARARASGNGGGAPRLSLSHRTVIPHCWKGRARRFWRARLRRSRLP